jgi:hypothetical protein
MKNKIKEFARNTLGCNCPEEVFDYIDCQSHVEIDQNSKADYVINIGNRLLIFAACIDRKNSLRTVISELTQAGIKKRNKEKFNRFRLILLTSETIDSKQAQQIFESLLIDEKTHLHIIDKNDFPLSLNP